MTEFTFPSIYNFPPFFTIQPTESTRKSQLSLWCKLILNYCSYHHIFRLDIFSQTILDSPLFFNKKINRRLDSNGIRIIMEELLRIGRGDWIYSNETIIPHSKIKDIEKSSTVIIYWRTPNEWADIFYFWVQDNGLSKTILTKHELTHGDFVRNQEFYQLDSVILNSVLSILVKRGYAQVFLGSQDDDESGVKFY